MFKNLIVLILFGLLGGLAVSLLLALDAGWLAGGAILLVGSLLAAVLFGCLGSERKPQSRFNDYSTMRQRERLSRYALRDRSK